MFKHNAASEHPLKSQLKFHAPIDDADRHNTYSVAFETAIEAPKVCNIALAGPYGSGKSSILSTFFKQNQYEKRVVWVSLARFDRRTDDEARDMPKQTGSETTPDDQKKKNTYDEDSLNRRIEESILQQIFYSVKKSKLPYSRIRRLEKPNRKQRYLYPLLVMVYAILLWGLYSLLIDKSAKTFEAILDTMPFALTTLLIFLLLLYFFVQRTMQFIRYLRLDKVVFSGAEVSIIDEKSNTVSLLNRHIDEIIYFFQETGKDILIIEDLDRFNNRAIFTKLRDLNTLLNQALETKITFIYAVKDDLFAGENRPKFFEAIIPVIPYVNATGGARDIFAEKLDPEHFEAIGSKLLRDIALYIHDYRLLSNICNEYLVYLYELKDNEKAVSGNISEDESTALGTSTPDFARKLFALIVYKNFFPEDFARLHQGSGWVFAKLHADKESLRIEKLKKFFEEKGNADEKILAAQKEFPRTVEEMKLTIIGNALQMLSEEHPDVQVSHFHLAGTYYTPFELSRNPKAFDLFMEGQQIRVRQSSGTNTVLFFRFDREKAKSRLRAVDYQRDDVNKKLQKSITGATKKIADISLLRLAGLLKLGDSKDFFDKTDELYKDSMNPTIACSPDEIERRRGPQKLLIYLLRNGHIDEEYGRYISYLYKDGVHAYSDLRFLQAVNDVDPQPFNLTIVDPAKVIDDLDIDTFKTSAVYIFTLTDYLFASTALSEHASEAKKAMLDGLWDNDPKDYIEAYAEHNPLIDNPFFIAIALTAPGAWEFLRDLFGIDAIAPLSYKLLIVHYHIKEKNLSDEYKKYIEANNDLLGMSADLSQKEINELLHNVKLLNLRFSQLGRFRDNVGIQVMKELFEQNCITATMDTIRELNRVDKSFTTDEGTASLTDSYMADYDLISIKGKVWLVDWIDQHIKAYIKDVLPELIKDKNYDPTPTIVRLLNQWTKESSNIDEERLLTLKKFSIPLLTKIPGGLWSRALEYFAVVPTWANLCSYFKHINRKVDNSLVEYLQPDIYSQLDIDADFEDEECRKALVGALLENPKLHEKVFENLIKTPYHYDTLYLGELGISRIKQLLTERKISCSQENFEALRETCGDEWKIPLSLLQQDLHFSIGFIDDLALDEEDFAFLLDGKIADFEDRYILLKIALESFPKPESWLSKSVANSLIALMNSGKLYRLSHSSLSIAFESIEERETKIRLILYSGIENTNMLADLIDGLGDPYSELVTGELGQVTLRANNLNRSLLKFLSEKAIIGKWTDNKLSLTVYRRKHW